MIAQYTETLREYIDNCGGQLPTTISNLFSKFPLFYVDEDTTFDMETLFIDKYEIREIGCETEQFFEHVLKDKLNEVIIEYVPRIKMFINNYENLYSRVVSLSRSEQYNRVGMASNDDTTGNFLNPTVFVPTTGQEEGKIQSKNKTINNSNLSQQDNIVATEDKTYGYFKTNPEIMKAIFEIKSQYLEALEQFQTLFMGVY